MAEQPDIVSMETAMKLPYQENGNEVKMVMLPPAHAGIPKYLNIKRAILHNIRTRVFQPGERIPPESWFCKAYGVSAITVRRAFRELIREDALYAKQGKGTFVKRKTLHWRTDVGSFSKNMVEKSLSSKTVLLEVTQVTDAEVARLLDLPDGAPLTRIRRLRLANGEPAAVSISFTPREVFSSDERALLEHRPSLYEVLARKGIQPYYAEEYFSVEVVSEKEIYRLLQCGRNDPLIYGQRFNYNEEKKPFEYTRNYLRSDLYKIVSSHRRID